MSFMVALVLLPLVAMTVAIGMDLHIFGVHFLKIYLDISIGNIVNMITDNIACVHHV